MNRASHALRVMMLLVAGISILLLARYAEAHAILKESSPAAYSSVAGPDVPLKLKFNVRIDAARSKVQIANPDKSTIDMTLETQPSPDTLTAIAKGLKPGAYKIVWQVLAPDGHITRGEVPFKVTGS
jgi:copper resistance protein C